MFVMHQSATEEGYFLQEFYTESNENLKRERRQATLAQKIHQPEIVIQDDYILIQEEEKK